MGGIVVDSKMGRVMLYAKMGGIMVDSKMGGMMLHAGGILSFFEFPVAVAKVGVTEIGFTLQRLVAKISIAEIRFTW